MTWDMTAVLTMLMLTVQINLAANVDQRVSMG